jgi:hypothetical protein
MELNLCKKYTASNDIKTFKFQKGDKTMEELREEMENDFREVIDDEEVEVTEMTTVEHIKGIGRNTKKWFKAHWKGITFGGLAVLGGIAAIEKLVSSVNDRPELPDNSSDTDYDYDVVTEISDDGQTMTTRIVYPEDNNVDETNGVEL